MPLLKLDDLGFVLECHADLVQTFEQAGAAEGLDLEMGEEVFPRNLAGRRKCTAQMGERTEVTQVTSRSALTSYS